MPVVRVGIIGANPDRGWALSAHLPALQRLETHRVTAVATSRAETAQRAREVYGADYAFSDARELIGHPEVDLVVVTVKVPLHHQMVSEALSVGKDVLCEWPLGHDLAEAEDLAARAGKAGVQHAVGLQARSAGALHYVRDLLADGFVGEVLSSSVVASGFGWGGVIDPDQTYLFDGESAATMVTVTGGHMLDAICSCLGPVGRLSAVRERRRRNVVVLPQEQVNAYRRFAYAPPVGEEAADLEVIENRTPDQLAVAAVLASGAVLSVHLRGGVNRSTNFLWEINGTEGDMVVEAAAGTIQINRLSIRGGRGLRADLEALPIPASYRGDGSGPSVNVERLYQDMVEQRNATVRTYPDFDAAVGVHRLIDAIDRAAQTGRSQEL